MKSAIKAAWIGFGGMVAGALLTGFFMFFTQSSTQHNEVKSLNQSVGVTAKTARDTYHVESKSQSGGITAGKVQINVNPDKPKLMLLKDRTKVQVSNGLFEKKFYFRNPDGRALQQISLKVTFDKEFISVKGDKWVWTGMIAKGSEKTQPYPASRSMVFHTAVLEPIAFIEVTVTSKHDIQIKDVEFKAK